MNRSVKTFATILGVMTAGVAIGLLIAPQKGKKLRKKIKNIAGKWMRSSDFPASSKYTEDVEENSPTVSVM
jgi:gas vesicle protein